MGKEEIRKIVACLLTARTNARLPRPGEFAPPPTGGQLQQGKSGNYVIGMKGSTALNSAVEILLHDKVLGEKFSRDVLRQELDMIFSNILTMTNLQQLQPTTKLIVRQMIHKLENTPLPEWTVIIPISGLALQVRSLDVGNVTFINFSRIASSKRLERKYLSNDKSAFVISIKSRLQNRVLAIVKVNAADANRAEHKGSDQIENALNILRFYLRVVAKNDPFFYRMYIAVEGTTLRHHSDAYVLSSASNNMSSKRTGALFPFIVDSSTHKGMKKLSFLRISAILKKEEKDRTELENLLLLSIDSFGEGMNDLKSSNSFINFITSLESLLLSENETIRGLLAERVALVVADKYENRIKVYEQMLRLYKLRSDLVHSGLNYITPGDVSMLSYLSFLAIRKILRISDKISTSADLINTIKKLKFGAPRFRAA